MHNQEAFDLMLEHIRHQGKPSVDDKHYSRYRGNVRDKIREGAYKNTMPLPVRPVAPAGLRKRVGEIDLDEMSHLMKEKAEYEQALEQYKADIARRREEEYRIYAQFQADLEEENGLTDHPKADALWNKAWERGHSDGLESVLYEYEDLSELLER